MATLAGSIATNSSPWEVALNFASLTSSEIMPMLSLKNRGSAKTSFIRKPPINLEEGTLYKIYCCEVVRCLSKHYSLAIFHEVDVFCQGIAHFFS